jgi:hypothetical protein
MPRPLGGYKLANGTEVPGVTTITDRFLDRKALMFWAFKQGKSGANSLYDKMEQAGLIGTCVHGMIELDLRGARDEVIFEYARDVLPGIDRDKAKKSFDAYRMWKLQFSFRVTAQEVSLVSEKYKYGGTIDTVGVVGNSLALLDYKSGKGIYCDQLLQMAAYGQLWNENHPDNPLTGGFHLIRLDKETGEFSHRYYAKLPQALNQFLLFRRCFDLDKVLSNPKMLAGTPVAHSLRRRRAPRAKSPTTPIGSPPYAVNMTVHYGAGLK